MNKQPPAANERIREADEHTRIMLEANPHVTALFDSSFKLVDCNTAACKFFGFETKEEMLDGFQERITKIIPPLQSGERPSTPITERFETAVKEGSVSFETELILNGETRNLSVEFIKIPCKDSFFITAFVFDVTEISKMQHELERNQGLLYAMNSLSSLLLNSDIDTFESALFQSMKTIAEAVRVDRMYIWKNYMIGEQRYCSQVYEWSERAEPQQGKELAIGLSYGDIPEWEKCLSSGKCINEIVRDMPPEEQEILSPQDILSVMMMPVFIKNTFWGFVGFDDCTRERKFTEEEESILRSSSVLFANAWHRNEMVVSLRDTSNRLEAALKQAETANKAKSSFLSTISHEIRTPMNAILGVTEIQLQKTTLDADMKEAFDRIYVSGDMLLGIINDILDLSKIEAGKLELTTGYYETASLISDTARLNIMRIGGKPIEFELDIDENLPLFLSGDELRVKQILNNLLSNAFKYTKEGKVTLSFTTEINEGGDNDGVTLVFSVTDTGQGMTKEQIDHLFDEYSRFNQEANRTTEGTGLGMSIMKNLTSMMRGNISIKSEEDKGSTFTVRLPQGRVNSEVLGTEMVENLHNFRSSGGALMKRVQIEREPMPYGSILIVDDMESNLFVARGLLVPYNLKIDTANSGFAAIEKIKNGGVYDIIFMDHMMPKIDGIKATEIIRSMGYKHPIIALTGNVVAGQKEIFLQNGFDGFIPKPIDIRRLNTVLNKFIRDKQLPEVIKEARLSADKKEQFSLNEPHRDISPRFAEIFTRDANRSLAVLDQIYEKNGSYNDEEIRLFTTHVHGMKTTLANIGRQELSEIALKLEKAGRNGDIEFISSETGAFIDLLRALIQELTPKDEKNAEPFEATDSDRPRLLEKLLEIKAACEMYDENTADNIIEDLKERNWSQSTKEFLSTITTQLLHSNFDEIAEAIDEFMLQTSL